MNPIERLKQAYEANNIPWDAGLANLSTAKALALAEHWEDRAEGFDVKTLREPLRKMAGVNVGKTGACRAVKAAEARYNG